MSRALGASGAEAVVYHPRQMETAAMDSKKVVILRGSVTETAALVDVGIAAAVTQLLAIVAPNTKAMPTSKPRKYQLSDLRATILVQSRATQLTG